MQCNKAMKYWVGLVALRKCLAHFLGALKGLVI